MSPTHGADGELRLALVTGVPMLKISSKKIKQVIVRLVDGAISWHSRKGTKGQLVMEGRLTLTYDS